MKKKCVAFCMLVVLLFVSAAFNIQFADTSTRHDLVNAIGQMDIPYALEFYFAQGMNQAEQLSAPIDFTDTALFRNENQVYDRIQVSFNLGIDPFMTDQAQGLETISYITINNHNVTISEYERNGEKIAINFAHWTSGSFNVILSIDDVEPIFREENIAILTNMVTMIDNALVGITVDMGMFGQVPSSEPEEVPDDIQDDISEEEPVEDTPEEPDKEPDEDIEEEIYSYSLKLESNSQTNSEYKGVTLGAESSLEVYLDLGPSFTGTVYVHPLKIGTLDGIETERQIESMNGRNTFVYRPPKYLTSDEFTQNKVIEEVIKVDIITEKSNGKNSEEKTKKTMVKTIVIERPPVMLVHGFTGDASTWGKLDERISKLGYATVREYYAYNDKNGESIPAQAKGLSRHIRQKLEQNEKEGIKSSEVDVVAHSMGGLITRYLITRLPHLYDGNIRKLIMVGTPNNGCGTFDNYVGWGG